MDLEKRSQTPSAKAPARLRASDADRDRAADILADALATGRLDPVEHGERIDGVYNAKTVAELEPFVEDLPAPGGKSPSFEKAPASAERDEGPEAPDETLHAIFGDVVRKGRWRVARRTHAFAVFGDVVIDLSEAVFEHQKIVIKGFALFGDVKIRVPENVSLRGRGAGIFGSVEVDRLDAEDKDAPVVQVEGFAAFGDIKARPKRGKLVRDLRGYLRKKLED
ncbi:DUF1707 SHOCT-like domain-containing protein [Streptomyces aureoverticillatus]|uniref:DUF1707 SHOCT-like domain-containing protein n=1 Tax=Streptomyces aureoverticillatus TaxID=66871 RepID=UPI0013DBEFD9|nr:DUF1707 domain-containing protein [Streptomyces aureoverticillatus]QIB43800.1 DUF1707 domain-containing protein [Streptomyces aureoverticillatus]